jgi:hypothetical protein
MTNALQIDATANEAETITGEIWETGPSAEIMLQMLWESKGFRQANQITKYEPHFHLFAAWSARRVSHLLTDERSHHAIRTAELFAAGATTRTEMHQAHLHAEAVVIQLAETHKQSTPPTTETPKSKNDGEHPTGVDACTLFGASVLHAASTASMACYATQIFGGLQAAEACAKYSSKALYWEMLTNRADSVLITEFLEEEARRQAQALRIFLGNPFNSDRSPAMTLPAQHRIAGINQQSL